MPRKKADPQPTPPKKPKRKRAKSPYPKLTQNLAAYRPRIYEAGYCPRANHLALLGLTDVEIAGQFGIAPETLYLWKDQYPDFMQAIEGGKVPADGLVAAAAFKRAVGYEQPAVKIFLPAGATDPVYAPYLEHIPGDVRAQTNWLNNRQPDRWRDRKNINVTGGLEYRLGQLTPEQRLDRLRELQAKALLTIEGEATEVEE